MEVSREEHRFQWSIFLSMVDYRRVWGKKEGGWKLGETVRLQAGVAGLIAIGVMSNFTKKKRVLKNRLTDGDGRVK